MCSRHESNIELTLHWRLEPLQARLNETHAWQADLTEMQDEELELTLQQDKTELSLTYAKLAEEHTVIEYSLIVSVITY